MKISDLVKKTSAYPSSGGDIGVIVEIKTNGVGDTMVTVLCEQKMMRWHSEFIEVINDPGDIS